MSLHRVFVYGTLKQGEPNHHWMTDTSKGFSRFLGDGRTVKKYPLVIGTNFNIPFILDRPGHGHVRCSLPITLCVIALNVWMC
jgi:gamma-glutamylaminecyclotransferase